MNEYESDYKNERVMEIKREDERERGREREKDRQTQRDAMPPIIYPSPSYLSPSPLHSSSYPNLFFHIFYLYLSWCSAKFKEVRKERAYERF